MNTNECPACGSSLEDRKAYANGDEETPLDLYPCPYCGKLKCCICDSGDDVRCMECGE